VKEKQISN